MLIYKKIKHILKNAILTEDEGIELELSNPYYGGVDTETGRIAALYNRNMSICGLIAAILYLLLIISTFICSYLQDSTFSFSLLIVMLMLYPQINKFETRAKACECVVSSSFLISKFCFGLFDKEYWAWVGKH